MIRFHLKVAMYLAVICFSHLTAEATELHLKRQANPQTSLVVLGDLTEIYDTDPQVSARLAKVELFPAPVQMRSLRIRELQDLLVLRGIDLRQCRFGGASVVSIHPVPAKSPLVQQVGFTTETSAGKRPPIENVHERVAKSIVKYLNVGVEKAAWNAVVDLTPAQIAVLSDPDATITAGGGQGPFTGSQQFSIHVRKRQSAERVLVNTHVTRPATMAVAFVRPVARDEIIRADHLTLDVWKSTGPSSEPILDMEEVIGKQATRPLAPGSFVERRSIRPPVLVERNTTVLVTVFTAGVRVRTYAKACEQGALGDLILVKTTDGKQAYTARVSGPREVEVFAQGVSARQEEAEPDYANTPPPIAPRVPTNR